MRALMSVVAMAGFGVALISVTSPASVGQAATGSITGRVHLTGKAPGNTVIRMGKDPRCSELTAGKNVAQMMVVANAKGDLANAFVSLKGTFPDSPAPAVPVVLDQKDCIFVPRVMGARVGQAIEIKSSDPTGHNAHAQSEKNIFNLSQIASSTLTSKYTFKSEEVMLRITCDAHSWMVAYVGVVAHPYFAVTGEAGTFTIGKVPAGTQTIQVWHERYGLLTKTVTVAAGRAATVDFAYAGTETAPRG